MHLNHKPGEIMQVDWAGDTAAVIDTDTGEVIPASQFDIPRWPEKLSDPLLADVICDRIVHDAYTVVIGGKESMRKRKGLQEV